MFFTISKYAFILTPKKLKQFILKINLTFFVFVNIGLKIYPKDLENISSYSNLFSHIEVQALLELSVKKLQDFDYNYHIHVPHQKFGFNPGQKNNLNEKIIKHSLELADKINSKNIIVHPGFGKNAKANMLDFFDDFFDKRMLLENCPLCKTCVKYLFSLPEEMKEFQKRYKSSFILDVGHAICSASNLDLDVFQTIFDFEKLNPKGYHIYGTNIHSPLGEEHKHFHQVKTDYSYISKLNKNSFFTLETAWVEKSIKEDYEKNINFLQSFF